ncbi:hypothetical protein [Levilactobacillus andaensis]|uniref:hypothetical protein n=1 Tax=Levilactobacillus andaensis TaxID=2799570 RepID=UPI0019425687|nr:hypothetical protein [Levilactobacillus andaensis]
MAKWWSAIRTILLLSYLLWWYLVFSTGTYHGLLSWIGLVLLVILWVGDRRYHYQHRYTAWSWLWLGVTDVILAVVVQFALNAMFGFAWYQPVILVLLVIVHSGYVFRLGRQTTG